MPANQPETIVSSVGPVPMLPQGVVFTDHPDAEMDDTTTSGKGAYSLTRHRYVRAQTSVYVTLVLPFRRKQHRVITGRLLGELHVSGALHHYRVVATDGVVYLAPPAWLAPESRVAIVQAGLTVPKRMQTGVFPDPAMEPAAPLPRSCR